MKFKIIAIVLCFIVIGCLIIVGLKVDPRANVEVETCPEIAMLNVEYLGLYENLYDSTEMFFEYRIDNFGNKEAKNVKVNCKIWDTQDNLMISVIDSVGNIASNSYYLGEVMTDNIETDEEGSLTCYVESCDDCKILLEGIPELMNLFK